jgi:hypothetical protein
LGWDKVNVIRIFLPVGSGANAQTSTAELVMGMPLDQLEAAVKDLQQCRPHAEVRQAIVERIARAPLEEFEVLKSIFLNHCGDTPK